MPQQRTTKQGRAYGQGFTAVWGGICPYGSTAGGSAPVVPVVGIDPSFGVQPKWCKFTAQHDTYEVGKLKVMLDSDTYDLHPIPRTQINRKMRPGSVFLPSTTAGSGVQVTSVQTGPATQATIPVTSIVTASGGAGTTATCGYVVATGVLTITANTSATNATVVAALNAWAAYTGTPPTAQPLVASVVGSSADVFWVSTTEHMQLVGGESSEDMGYASVFVASTTSPYGILYTANKPGAWGNSLSLVFVDGGAGTAASAVILGNVITLTIDTSATGTVNDTIITAINVTGIGGVGKYITATLVTGTSRTPTHAVVVAAMADVAVLGSTTAGVAFTGGGLTHAVVDERIYPFALGANGLGVSNYDQMENWQQVALPLSKSYSHFTLRTYRGDTAIDLDARSQLFVPSATQGAGVMFNSIATAATAATGTYYSNAPTNTHGNIFTALQPGDAGNSISFVFANPQATVFIASTTGGSGLLFQAAAAFAGTAGQAITVLMAAPNAQLTAAIVNVIGNSIQIYPCATDTNTSISAAVAAVVAAANLVGTPTVTGTGSDLVIGNNGVAQSLGGGYVAVSSTTCTVQVSGSTTSGWVITVEFGTGVTNALARTAILAAAGPTSANPILNVTALSTTTDVIVAGALSLSGGLDTTDYQVLYTSALSTGITISVAGNSGTLTVSSTTNFPTAGTLNIVDSLGAVEQIAYTGVTATTFTTCTGGNGAATFAVGAVVQLDTPVAVYANSLLTMYLGYTAANNTNAALAAAANAVMGSSMTAVPVNSSTDLNAILPNGLLAWAAYGLQASGAIGAQSLECLNLITFPMFAIDSDAGTAGT